MSSQDLWHPVASKRIYADRTRGSRYGKKPRFIPDETLDKPARYRRHINGLDPHATSSGWLILRHPIATWMTCAAIVIYALVLYASYITVGHGLIGEIAQATKEANGIEVVLTWDRIHEAALTCAGYAAMTMIVLGLVLVCLDRIRPLPWTMKILSLGWGASIAIFISLHVNTWAGELMKVEGSVDPSQGSRTAIFSAPFVEEAAKATILFLLACCIRRRIVSINQSVILAALSGIGFAFSENVVYYLRTFLYAATTYDANAQEDLSAVVALRGIATCFGHPLFTSLTAIGIAIALRNRSTIVRILAPLGGYFAAVSGHMIFNGFASTGVDSVYLMIGGWIAVGILVGFLIYQRITHMRIIRARLDDFVQAGWLEQRDPVVFSRYFGRWKMVAASLLRGWRSLRSTMGLQRAMTELAYVRDSELNGCLDEVAIERQRELIDRIRQLRLDAIDDVRGYRMIPPIWFSWMGRQRKRLAQWIMRRPTGNDNFSESGKSHRSLATMS